MLDRAYLDNCLRIIVCFFLTDCNELKTFNERKSLVSTLLKISNPFLWPFILLFGLTSRHLIHKTNTNCTSKFFLCVIFFDKAISSYLVGRGKKLILFLYDV